MPAQILPPAEPPTQENRWPMRLSAGDITMCRMLAARAGKMVRDYKRERNRHDLLDPDEMLIMMDFALVHAVRGLELWQLLNTSDLDFMHDFFAIQRVMSHPDARFRVDGTFPADVHLQYAKKQVA